MLAEMLTKAIQANVAREARPASQQPEQESPMNDDAVTAPVNTATDSAPAPDPAQDPAPNPLQDPAPALTPAPTPDAPDASAAAPGAIETPPSPPASAPPASAPTANAPTANTPTDGANDIDARLARISELVKTLSEKPEIHKLLLALVGPVANKDDATN